MKTRRRKQESFKNEKIWKGFYNVSLMIGLVLLAFEVKIYRKTFIDIYIPISIILAVGLLTFYFNRTHYKKTYSLNGNFFPVIHNLFSWGAISSYIFMATNCYSADKIATEYQFQIKEKSLIPGRIYHRNERQPVVKIDYFSFEKELVFHYADTEKVNKTDSIRVTVRKGGLGFDIFKDYDLID